MFKKLAKIALWIGVGFLILMAAAYIFVQIKYPPDEIKKILITEAEKAINRRVTIERLWINPIKGFTLDTMCVYDIPAADSIHVDSPRMFAANRLQLRYRLFSLLRKKIQIHEILFDDPEIFLSQNEQQVWNFEDIVAVDTALAAAAPATAPPDSAAEFSLPFSVKLKKLEINNVTAYMTMFQPPASISVKTGGLSVHLNDVSASLKSIEALKQEAKASLSIFSNDLPWDIKIQPDSSGSAFEFSSVIALNLKTVANGAENISTAGTMLLTNASLRTWESQSVSPKVQEFPLPTLFGISLDLLANIEQQQLDVNDFTAALGEETIFRLNGHVTQFLEQPRIFLDVTKSDIRLQNVKESFATMLPDSIQDELNKIDVAGVASLRGSQFSGNPLSEEPGGGLKFNLKFSINNFSAAYSEPEAKLNNLNLTTTAVGFLNATGVLGTTVKLILGADSLSVKLDTLAYEFAGLHTNLSAHLNSEFFPDSVEATVTLDDFFKTRLNLLANFAALDRLNKYKADVSLDFQELSLAAATASAMEGAVDLDVKIASQSLDSIDVALKFASDILEIPGDPEPIIVYPIDIFADAVIRADTTFQNFNLKNLTMQVSDFLSAKMHGSAFVGNTQAINLSVDNIDLNHKNAMMVVPEQFLLGLETLEVFGNTCAKSKVTIDVDEKGEPTIFAAGKIEMNAGVNFLAQFLRIGSIKNRIEFETDALSGKIRLHADVDSLFVAGVLEKPLRNVMVDAIGNAPDFESFVLDSAKLHIPDFKTDVRLTGVVDSLSGNLQAAVKSETIVYGVDETIEFPGLISVRGVLKQSSDIRLKGNLAEIDGRVTFENFCLKYDTLAQVDSVVGIIQFTEKLDIEKGMILEGKESSSFLASTSSSYYDLLRPYYYRGSSEKFSSIHIKKITAMEYNASDLNIDILIQNQRVEIPRFALQLYDGNMAGLVSVNVGAGEPDDIQWKVKADLSRLNSAKLLPSARGKEKNAELNLNLELEGQGVDPASRLDVKGYLYVTKIGPQFTDNVLQSLDPKGIDKSIQDTRMLLNWGYKPRLISFEIKHDNLYPSIHLVKGKFLTKLIPLNLAGGNKIELARIPIKFFLSNMAVTTN